MQQCPSCSAIISFASDHTNVIECTCGKIISKKDDYLTTTVIPTAKHSNEFIVPGTKGQWQGQAFKITGRFCATGDDWILNYWNVIFNNGEKAYLSEGYGHYAILKETKLKEELHSNKVKLLSLNNYVQLQNNETFYLIRKNEDVQLSVEGEIFLPGASKEINILDFYSTNATYITLLEFDGENICYYDTSFVDFADLKLTGLKGNARPVTYSCLHCFKTLDVIASPFTLTVSCSKCGTHHLLNTDTGTLKDTGRNKTDIQPDIAIGSSGTINGILFNVIGYSQKKENTSDASRWKEYVLYNREQGFAFLSEFEGHWIYVKEQMKPPALGKFNAHHFNYGNEEFELFNSYTYDVINAAGEHPYNIVKTAGYKVREFISPPRVWFVEENKNEANWFLGNHIDSKAVLKSFTFPGSKPVKQGIGMVQPLGAINIKQFFKIIFIAILAFMAIHILTGMDKKEKIIFDQQFTYNDSSRTLKLVTGKFKLDKWKSNLEFHIAAAVNNNWFELQGTLINADNGKEYSFEKGVEYYSGYSDGEAWSEGSTTEDAYLTGIPPGTYFINLVGQRETGFNQINDFFLRVTYDVRADRNLLFAIIILAVLGAAQYYVYYHYNKKRWQNSRYSSYKYES